MSPYLFPYLFWACEIKYSHEEKGDVGRDNRKWDKDKLLQLLSQGDEGTEFGCTLYFKRTKSGSDGKCEKNNISKKLVEYIVT